jgi:hypothetical protein
LWRDLIPRAIEGVPDGFHLGWIKRSAFDQSVGFHGGD